MGKMTIKQLNDLYNPKVQTRIEKIYLDAWQKGVSVQYKDERCKSDDQYIYANPDGSEDLILFDAKTRDITILQKGISEPGKGRYGHLV